MTAAFETILAFRGEDYLPHIDQPTLMLAAAGP